MDVSRFKIRPLHPNDAERMAEWMRDEETTKFLNIGRSDYSTDDALQFIKTAENETVNIHRAVTDNGLYVGTISLKNINHKTLSAEYAIAMHPEGRGTGAATEATKQLLRVAIDQLGLRRIYLYVRSNNLRAIRFYEKNGFILESESLDEKNDYSTLQYVYQTKNISAEKTDNCAQKRNLVFFFSKKLQISGGLIFLLVMAKQMALKNSYHVCYVNYRNGDIDDLIADSKVSFINLDDTNYSLPDNSDYFVPLNYLFFFLEKAKKLKNSKVLLYNWHPHLCTYLKNQFFYRKNDLSELLSFFSLKDGLSFMDKACFMETYKQNSLINEIRYIPVFTSSCKKDYASPLPVSSDRYRIGWLGRLDRDKIYSLINLADNIFYSNLDKPVDLHIIGDGNSKSLLKLEQYAPKIRFIFTSYLTGEDRDKYIRDNIDLMVAMGLSSIDTSNLSIPTIIPITSNKAFNDNCFVFLFDTNGYSLGWDKDDLTDLGCTTYSIRQAINLVYKNSGKDELGYKCHEFASKSFDIEKSTYLLQCALDHCSLSIDDCLSNKQIKSHLKAYRRYCLFHGKKNRNYDSFILFNQKLNRMQNGGIIKKTAVLISTYLGPCKNLFISFSKNAKSFVLRADSYLKKKIQNPIIKHRSIKQYREIQSQYQSKIEGIKAIYKKTGKIKVLFPIIFKSVFPSEPIFQKMLNNDLFDPYILITPDMERSLEFSSQTYNDSYDYFSKKYPNNVLHGFDTERHIGIKLRNEYQVVCYNNPYAHMAHEYHNISNFLKYDVLNIYANYGFPAVKYWRNVMQTDFYNSLWKVCIESPLNYKELCKHEPIKGMNGIITGYLKMDRMSEIPEDHHERKRIIISPHHTVLGWKALNISNFLTYFDFFTELPKIYPQIDFIFRPHPLLFQNLKASGLWTETQIDDYISSLTKSQNMKYDQSADYFGTFINSDGIIHDCGSFTGEYLFTEKPCCYMLKSKKEIHRVMNPMGEQCLKQYYHAFSRNDICKFIDEVILKGNDPLKESRENFAKTQLKVNYPHGADMIIKLLEDTICT